MWRVALRDLQWRRRRFIIAVLATGLVFALTLLLSGTSSSLHAQDRRIVRSFGADAWLVAETASGPFTATDFVPEQVVDEVATLPGVEQADPVVLFHSAIGGDDPKDVNVIGYAIGGLGEPEVDKGRVPAGPGEMVADSALGYEPGDRVDVGGEQVTVVGESDDVTYYFGTPTVLLPVADVQAAAFEGQPFVSAVVTRGEPEALPDGLRAMDDAAVQDDLARPSKSGDQTITFINVLLWLVAAGIIGSIVYLSALERTRELAVMKATGATNRSLLTALALQAVVLAIAGAVVGAVLAQLLAPGFPFAVQVPTSAYVLLIGVAAGVGLLASAAGLRRAVAVDPAVAFGG